MSKVLKLLQTIQKLSRSVILVVPSLVQLVFDLSNHEGSGNVNMMNISTSRCKLLENAKDHSNEMNDANFSSLSALSFTT